MNINDTLDLSGAQSELQAALLRLTPAPGGLSLESIAFAAGARAARLNARRTIKRWQYAAAAASLLAGLVPVFLLKALAPPAAPGGSSTLPQALSPNNVSTDGLAIKPDRSSPQPPNANALAYAAAREYPFVLASDPGEADGIPEVRPLVAIDRAGPVRRARPVPTNGVLLLLEGI